MSGAENLFYARGELSVGQIEAEIARFWRDLDKAGNPVLDADLRTAGLDRSALGGVDRENAITVRAGTSGVDTPTVVLIVSLAPSANRIIQDLWKVVLIRIQRRCGADAIGDEKRGKEKRGKG
jgi:hypothetical protein